MKTTDKAPTWKGGTMYQRLQACRFMLHVHGLLPYTENERVKDRIAKRHRKDTR